ncbi:MAG: NAD(P)-dependent oxidoreductase [Myxococcales bacterium]|nr:NAD(P)-dependent oxidoreductase [Deltaproteobacteria bacterium]NNE17091.1 NAD(P)-dependent oxidoreductase [Myxococcales bacterium]
MPKLEGKILITGASGFIGSRLRDALLASGSDLVAIRRPGSPPASAGRSVEADYAAVADLERIVGEEKPDYVLHVAGVTKGSSYEDFRLGNVMPTRNLLAALRREHSAAKRFVLVSSLTSYGPSATSAPHREENPPRPIEHYGESKREAEEAVEEESGGVPWTILRPSGVYGPGDIDYFNLFQSAMMGWNLYFGNRERLMSVIYVDDCVRGILEAAQHPKSVNGGYFLTSDEQVTWEQFQSEVVRVVGRRARTVDLPEQLVSIAALGGELATRFDKKPRLLNLQKAKMGAQQAWTCVGDAAKRDFGFSAEVDLAEGIRRTHDWYEANDWYQSLNPKDLLSVRSLRGLARRFGRHR